MADFGWSVGDIIQGIKVVTAVCRAFSSTKGAEAHFADTVSFLRGLQATLQAIEQHVTDADGNPTGKYSAHIMGILETIEPPFKSFEKYVEGYQPAFGVNSRKSTLKRAKKKVEWAVEHLDKLSGKTSELKDAIASPMGLVVPLLVLQSIEDIKSDASSNMLQPHLNFGPSPVIHAFHQSDVAHRLQYAIDDLQAMMKRHEQALQSRTGSANSLSAALPANQDAQGASWWNCTLGQAQHSDGDTRMVMAIEMLREELKQSTEAILKILEGKYSSSGDGESAKNELELYRRTFKDMHQSLENSWSNMEEADFILVERPRRSDEVVPPRGNYRNNADATTSADSGNSSTLGVTALGSFFGSAMATAASMLFAGGETHSENAYNGRTTGDSHQFSSDFAGLIYASQRSSPTPVSPANDEEPKLENTWKASQEPNTVNPIKNDMKPTPCSNVPKSPQPLSIYQAQAIPSTFRPRETPDVSKSQKRNSPDPTEIIGPTFGALFNNITTNKLLPSQSPTIPSPRDDFETFTCSNTISTTTKRANSPKQSDPPKTCPDYSNSYINSSFSRNLNTPFSAPWSLPIPLRNTAAPSVGIDRYPAIYYCCRCHQVSPVPVMKGDKCLICEHEIDENCMKMGDKGGIPSK